MRDKKESDSMCESLFSIQICIKCSYIYKKFLLFAKVMGLFANLVGLFEKLMS